MSESKHLLLAYESTGKWREVVFAISINQAREILFAVFGTNDVLDGCKRAPWADRYAHDGAIPLAVRIGQGLSIRCSGCGGLIAAIATMVVSDSEAFCAAGCQEGFLSRRGMADADLSEAVEVAQELWPAASVLKAEIVDGRARVHFTFGCPARHAFWFVDEDQVQVAPVDEENWLNFNARMRLSRLGV